MAHYLQCKKIKEEEWSTLQKFEHGSRDEQFLAAHKAMGHWLANWREAVDHEFRISTELPKRPRSQAVVQPVAAQPATKKEEKRVTTYKGNTKLGYTVRPVSTVAGVGWCFDIWKIEEIVFSSDLYIKLTEATAERAARKKLNELFPETVQRKESKAPEQTLGV